MPVNKKQMQRLVHFVAMMKENKYPNCSSFLEELRRQDLHGNRNICCKNTKTIQRDIITLKDDFGAPIEYDHERRGYYLLNKGWDFLCPLHEEYEMLASVLGARIVEDIFPEPLRGKIRSAVDFQLTNNNPDFLDKAYMKSLIVSSGLKVRIDPDIFNTVFKAWNIHEALDIVYKDVADRQTQRRVEPHVLAFQDCAWFIRGWCLKHNAVRTFAVHRIVKAELSGKGFEPDDKIIEEVRNAGPFSYSEVRNVKIVCDDSIKKYVVEKPLHKDQKVESGGDGSFSLLIPSIWDTDLLHWILFQGGNARLVEPKSMLSRIAKSAEKMLAMHSLN